MVQIFKDVLCYESAQVFVCQLYGKVTKCLMGYAYRLIEKKALLLVEDKYQYLGKTSTEIIKTDSKICSCVHFCDKAVCKHILAGCLLDNIEFPGLLKMVLIFIYLID